MSRPFREYLVTRQRSFERQHRFGRDVMVHCWVEFGHVGMVSAQSATSALTDAIARFGRGVTVEAVDGGSPGAAPADASPGAAR